MLPASLKLRVLVVDDNRDAADTLGDLLRLYGAEVRVCYAGVDALELIPTFLFDAAVLDIHMPEMDGCELAKHLREASRPRRVLLVALTGVSDASARQRTAEAGFDLHLTKTVAADVLTAALVAFANWMSEHAGSEGAPPETDSQNSGTEQHGRE